jgi:glycosyltransferase involved in cell wall biosynthesis
MHILLIHQAFAALNEPGGTRHHELARYLAQRGHRVTIVASPVSYLTGKTSQQRMPWVERQAGGEGVTILRAYTTAALHRSFIHRVVSFLSFMLSSFLIGLRVDEIDLVWGTSPPIFQGITAWLLARLKGVPFLFEVRDLWPAFAVAVGVLRQPVLIRLSEWLERFLYRHADLLVVNSPGFIGHLQACGARRVELVPNGADTAMFNPQVSGAEFRTLHGLEHRYVVLYAGAHGMSNDLGVVLDAARLLQELPDVVILFIGDGKEKPALVERAASMGLENVRFIPPLAKAVMPAALAAADACLAILKPVAMYRTVYPNKVFDYMAAGKPVLLAIDGVIREVLEAAGAGIFVQPGDASALAQSIRDLREHPDRAAEMGRRGRHYVESHFERGALAELLEGLMLELVRSQPGAAKRR